MSLLALSLFAAGCYQPADETVALSEALYAPPAGTLFSLAVDEARAVPIFDETGRHRVAIYPSGTSVRPSPDTAPDGSRALRFDGGWLEVTNATPESAADFVPGQPLLGHRTVVPVAPSSASASERPRPRCVRIPEPSMIDYDLELTRLNAAFQGALEIRRTDQVLDIGCGAGETTRDAARMAGGGGALGIDRSEPMIERARALALAEGLGNVQYDCANVEEYSFQPHQFDIAISRFGTMFFADPTSAFSRVRLAMKSHARLAMIVWQAREHNEWAVEIQRTVKSNEQASMQAFSLGEKQTVQQILHTAGFANVAFAEVHEPVFYGSDAESAFAFVSKFLHVQDTLGALNAADRARTEERLRAMLEAHRTSDGVWFDSRAWIVSARRA